MDTEEFNDILDANERIVWSDKPNFTVHIISGIPFLILGLIWGGIDLMFFKGFSSMGAPTLFNGFMGAFMFLHLAPLWLSILNMLRLILTYKNTHFAITNKRVIRKSGFMGVDYQTRDFDKISHMEVNVNPVEKILKSGSILIDVNQVKSGNNRSISTGIKLHGIQEPYEVFRKLKTMSLDIKTDIQFPNEYRPETNSGYNTEYDKFD